jgi:hypothetical protein
MKARYLYFIPALLLFQFAIPLPGGGAQTRPTYLGYSDYQIITDISFPVEQYFRIMASHGVNFQRIWVTGYSDAAVKFEELMPFARRRERYQLSKISPSYIERLLTVMREADDYNQQVMLTLFDHWALARRFAKTPWYFRNNQERLLQRAFPDFYNIRDRKLMKVQENLVREIVRSTARFDPIYEIMNEAGGANCETLAGWHERVASWILKESPGARIGVNLGPECGQILNAGWVDVISFHQNSWERHGICGAVKRYPDKQIIIDTDGAWEIRDDNRLVRKWLAESASCGASFNHKDDIYHLDRELLEQYREFTAR